MLTMLLAIWALAATVCACLARRDLMRLKKKYRIHEQMPCTVPAGPKFDGDDDRTVADCAARFPGGGFTGFPSVPAETAVHLHVRDQILPWDLEKAARDAVRRGALR